MPHVLRLSLLVLIACGGSSSDDTQTTDDTQTDTGGTDGGCETGCVATLAADCPVGPTSRAGCVADCEMLLAGACQTAYEALLACGETSAVSCDPTYGFPIIDDCPDEQSAFLACLNG